MPEANGCCFVTEDGELCGEEAEVFMKFPVCDSHRETLRYYRVMNTQSLAKQALKYHEYSDFPGVCYIVLVPGGMVKIGYSNTEELYQKRLKSLSKQLGPVLELLTLPGGFITEASLHNKFHESSIPGNGELFTYSNEIADFIAEMKKGE